MAKTPQAQAAAMIKKQLTHKMGLQCRVTSASGSMTSSVTINIFDQHPDVVKDVEKYCDQFQQGNFNGMEDIYEYSNSRDDIPQAKYVFVQNQHSDELKQAGWKFIQSHCAGADDPSFPTLHNELANEKVFDEWATTIVYRLLGGSFMGDLSKEFWDSRKMAAPAVTPETSAPAAGHFTIEEYTHTKKGFRMFICIPADRVDRETYLDLLDRAKTLGGWYSRKWGTTPGGFAFKDLAKAEEFTGSAATAPETSALVEPGQSRPDTNRADSLRLLADKMTVAIDGKFADRMTNTPKRLAQANHARLEGERLQRTQQAVYALADLHETGTVPPELSAVRTKKAVYDLMGTLTEPVHNGYHGYQVCTGKPRHTSSVAVTLWSLIDGKTDDDKRADDLRRRREDLQFSKIPGYFPTPDNVIKKMLGFADIQPGECVLEPNGGNGAIIKAVVESVDTEVVSYETNYTLYTLILDSFPSYRVQVEQKDFLEVPITRGTDHGGFPKILMNPPFEKCADIKHIKHAVKMLAPGGRLVAICSAGPRQVKELQGLATHWEELPPGSFKGAGTGVNTCLMVIDN